MTINSIDAYNRAIADCLYALQRRTANRIELVKALSKLLVDDVRLPAKITAQGKTHFACSITPTVYGTRPALYVRDHNLCIRGRTGLEERAQTYSIPLTEVEKIEVLRHPRAEDYERKIEAAYEAISGIRRSSGVHLRNRRVSSSSGETIPELSPVKLRMAQDFQIDRRYIS